MDNVFNRTNDILCKWEWLDLASEHKRDLYDSLTIQTYESLHKSVREMILDTFGPKCVVYRIKNTHGTQITSMITETDDQHGTDVRDCVRPLLSQKWASLDACSSISYKDAFCNADRRINDHISI